MSKYYVRVKPQLDGENAVHKENCPFLDGIKLKRYLGEFVSAREAIKEAQKFYSRSKGCSFCNKELNVRARRNMLLHSYSLS